MSIDQVINESFAGISAKTFEILFYSIPLKGLVDDFGDPVSVPLLLVWLATAGIFFTLYLGFINLRYFKHGFDVLIGKYDEPDADGQLTNFQTLSTCLSGTVGLGNIAGVAVAVSTGGPGAVFWMMVMGFFGMSTKLVEVTLGVKYRHHPDPEHKHNISGGPMYYLRDTFSNKGLPLVGYTLAAIFSIFCIGGSIGGGNMFQANQAYNQLLNVTGGDTGFFADKGWLFGIGLAILVGLVIIGGIKSIANAASKIVPFMGGLYLLAGLIVILLNFTNIPQGLMAIFSDALSLEAGFGGLLGGLLVGVQRASFSNEAGLGSAAIVHSTAKTNKPVSQGFVGMLGPFIDTIVICMITALVIVFSGVYETGKGIEGVELTSRAFEAAIPGSRYVLALTVFLFAFSTIITWFYYGLKAITYLFGEGFWLELSFKIIFLMFVVIGASADLQNVIDFTDAMILSMAIPNIIGLYFMAPEIKRDVKAYIEELKESSAVEANKT
jgi:AGCS family alanine or glycine:cation symporter